MINSTGFNDVTLVFDNQPCSNQYNESWFVMNGFGIQMAIIADSILPVMVAPSDIQEDYDIIYAKMISDSNYEQDQPDSQYDDSDKPSNGKLIVDASYCSSGIAYPAN